MATNRRRFFLGATTLSAAAIAASLSACSTPEATAEPTPSDPDLVDALATALALRDGASAHGFDAIAADHSEHVEVLQRLVHPETVEAASTAITDVASLVVAEEEGASAAADAALRASEGYAVLLAQIAASRRSHVELVNT